MKKAFIYLLISIVTVLLSLNNVSATETSSGASDYLVETGERSLQSGDVQDAIHEFSKALMVDPDNEKAKHYLKQFHLDGGIYQGAQTRESQMGQLVRDIRDYEGQLRSLEQDRFHL